MLLQLVMIVSNGEDTIISCLESYLKLVDRYFICVNNSTDRTLELLKKFKETTSLPVIIEEIQFNGFSNTRNEAIRLANLEHLLIDWTIMPDDSYNFIGDIAQFKRELRTSIVDCLSILIKRDTISYYSKRVFKKGVWFKGLIHEVLDTENFKISKHCILEDIGTQYQIKRTEDRLNYDLNQLKDANDCRSLYYKAGIYLRLFMKGEVDISLPIEWYNKRINMYSTDYEETFMCHIHIGHLLINETSSKICNDPKNLIKNQRFLEMIPRALKEYIKAALIFPPRRGEAYYAAYLITGKYHWIKKAYDSRIYGTVRNRHYTCRLAVDTNLYSNNGVYGSIEEQYYIENKRLLLIELLKNF